MEDVDPYMASRSNYHVRAGEPPRDVVRRGTIKEAIEANLVSVEGYASLAYRSKTAECVFGEVKENRGSL